jgi:hypothetical protein
MRISDAPNSAPKSPPPAVATFVPQVFRRPEWAFEMHAVVQLKHDADPAALAGYVVAREIYESPAGPAEYVYV